MNLKILAEVSSSLVCPATKLCLELVKMEDAEVRAKGNLLPRADSANALGNISAPAGRTPFVLLREDNKCAYPVVDGIPILLAPEALSVSAEPLHFDLTEPAYAEAYEEMDFYNDAAAAAAKKLSRNGAYSILPTELDASEAERQSFPDPWQCWVDAVYDSAGQLDAYRHLGSVRGKSVLQLGGGGTHAIKFAMAGAAEAWLVTPMIGEAQAARALGEAVGLGEQMRCVVAVAEELPIRSETIDAIFAGGCLHHMQTEIALPEAARVLRKGGRFAAIEPWCAPFYAIGTKIFGKREAAYCRPLTKARIEPLAKSFRTAHVIQHGTLTRYPFLALSKLGINVSKSIPWYFGKVDDAVCSLIPGMRGMGSSIAVLGSK